MRTNHTGTTQATDGSDWRPIRRSLEAVTIQTDTRKDEIINRQGQLIADAVAEIERLHARIERLEMQWLG